jgi:hypothetical protein
VIPGKLSRFPARIAHNEVSATMVKYGQGGSFITHTANNGGISANSLDNPYCVAVYAGRLYIADSNNNRVLYY